MNESPRILVVDDNRSLGENIAEILDDAGYAADYFERPADALRALRPGAYRAAVLDIRMPEMDGIELYREIKALDAALPAVAMTAWSDDDRVRAAVREGIVAVFPKPVDAALLLTRLDTLVHGEPALVVEDDDGLSQDLCELLTDGGWAVRSSPTCAEARALAAATPPVLLVADWRLPDGDGIELANELSLAYAPPCVLVFSGYPRDPRRPAAQGATFLEKPVDLQRLLELAAEVRARRASS